MEIKAEKKMYVEPALEKREELIEVVEQVLTSGAPQ